MTISKSGLFVVTWKNFILPTYTTVSPSMVSQSNKFALFSDSFPANAASDFNTASAFASTPFTSNQVNDSVNWPAGGVTIGTADGASAPTWALGSDGQIKWDMADFSVASTTLTNAKAGVFYADPLSDAPAKPAILLVNFGSNYSTVAGTFAITWDSAGVMTLTCAS
jgi:hypothetical protein